MDAYYKGLREEAIELDSITELEAKNEELEAKSEELESRTKDLHTKEETIKKPFYSFTKWKYKWSKLQISSL